MDYVDFFSMHVVDCLNKLIEYFPNKVFFNFFALGSMLDDEILKVASFTIFHCDINGEIFFIDLEVVVFEDMHIAISE